ncbi:hypothetical protein NDU88_012323 [Pleurodeles waltl]|uniref:Uncharacterized protein n=1 Tax=Pleurodeles waltl TaxID=8319 RepID=A0AAV7R0B7_PLEWA|nr:hypothetical protein NDU88_012323 [Pleurodeles waltl]
MSSLGRILEPVLETRDTTGERLGRASGLEVLCCSALMNIELEIKNTYVIPDSSLATRTAGQRDLGKDMLGSLSVRMSSLGRILEPVLETRDTTGERLGRASGLESAQEEKAILWLKKVEEEKPQQENPTPTLVDNFTDLP